MNASLRAYAALTCREMFGPQPAAVEVVDAARRIKAVGDSLMESALASGAMPRDVDVECRLVPSWPGMRVIVELA